ncbi:hypothetical protein VPH35_096084 [Triticum aestivum]
MPGMEEAEDYASCAFSLTCPEDGAELGDGVVDDGDLFFFYSGGAAAADDEDGDNEYVEQLVSKEASFCSSSDSGDADCSSAASEDWFLQARLAAVKWILETRGCFGFGHRTAYLAIAYFDRFFLRRRVDRAAMPWAARLLSVACVSVAAKMEEYCAPALSELDAGGGYEFCSASVRRMELLVLSTLGWRMAAVTPFDYLPCFSSRLDRHDGRGGGGHDPARVALKSIGFIFATAEGHLRPTHLLKRNLAIFLAFCLIDLCCVHAAGSVLDYRPSTVAAAAILAASYGALLTKEALESKMDNLSPSCPIEKEHVHACYSMMVGDLRNRKSNGKRSLPCSDSNEVATSTYDSVLVDDVADTAAFMAAVSEMNKRIRLEPPGIH